jgi:transcriptional regulator with XRE-family HTH domain
VSERGASRSRTRERTKLASARLERSLTQRQVADFAGLALSSYRRLERGQTANPPLRWLVNLQHVLALEGVSELIEDEWLEFRQLRAGAPTRPPDSKIIRSRPAA